MSCVLSSVMTAGYLTVLRNCRVSCRSRPPPGIVRRFSQAAVEFETSKFGELIVRSESICDVSVKTIDPQLFPHQNKAFFDFQGKFAGRLLDVVCTSLDEVSRLSLSKKHGCFYEDEERTCHASVPIKYDIDVDVTGSRSISLVSMQNDSVRLKSQLGDCTLSHIQSRNISVSSAEGNVTSEGLLQGDVVIETSHLGRVALFKPLCRHLVVKTDAGNISIGSLYAEHSLLSTHSGNVDIRNAHRVVHIKIVQEGNITINSLDGDLEAEVNKGNVTMYASRHESIRINVTKGDITIKVPPSLTACRLDLSANMVSLDNKLDQVSLLREEKNDMVFLKGLLSSKAEELSSISAHTSNGEVQVVCQDFINSLNLTKFAEYDSDEDS